MQNPHPPSSGSSQSLYLALKTLAVIAQIALFCGVIYAGAMALHYWSDINV